MLITVYVAAREAELRQLRKSNTDYEQQNAILQKHIENMKAAVEKLEVETMQQRNYNVALQQHLDHMRATLTASFQNIPLPGV
jgi:predicted  nucleic acid-binding Zn-ribbon protein